MELKRSKGKSIAALIIGNALEWYDFMVYSLLAIYISQVFFPQKNQTGALLATTATFGAAFLLRPLGGIFLGIYADKHGRKACLNLMIACMFIATLVITLTPTYAQIGVFAPSLLVLARLLQGFSAGGEFGTATALLFELAPKHKSGLYCSWQMFGQIVAILMGVAAHLLLAAYLTEQQLYAWGWRIPFLIGLLILPIGIIIRRTVTEIHPKHHSNKPISILSSDYSQQFFIALGLIIGVTGATYVSLVYLPIFAHVYLHIPLWETYSASFVGLIIALQTILLFGWFADKYSRSKLMLAIVIGYLVLAFPLFYWLGEQPSFVKLLLVQVILAALSGAYFGVYPVILATLFPAAARSTALSISYNIAVMLFGGFAPFTITWLITNTGSTAAIAYYLTLALAISTISSYVYYRKKNEYSGMVNTAYSL